jgi:hypothetical protein
LHVFDLSGSIGADVMIVHSTAPSYSSLDVDQLFKKYETLQHGKHVLKGPTMIPLVMNSFGKLGPAAEGYLQSLATVAHSSGVVGIWLRIARQFLMCALVRGCGVVFRHYYRSMAKCTGRDFRDGAIVPFE